MGDGYNVPFSVTLINNEINKWWLLNKKNWFTLNRLNAGLNACRATSWMNSLKIPFWSIPASAKPCWLMKLIRIVFFQAVVGALWRVSNASLKSKEKRKLFDERQWWIIYSE